MNAKSIVTLLGMLCMTPVWSAAEPTSQNATPPTTDQVIEQFRIDLQAAAADVMAKGLTLTAEQAAKFWPMFEALQKEQKAIIDEQLKALVHYQDTYKFDDRC
jgi:Spy/CpxP family protein refolding chaperone